MKYRPFFIVLALLGLAVLALQFTVNVAVADQPGIRLALPPQLGAWRGTELRFCHNTACLKDYTLDQLRGSEKCPACGSDLHTMSLVEYESLPKDTGFLKGRYTNSVGEEVYVSIVLSGRERESIHRPERCLVGQGNSIDHSSVQKVPLAGQAPLGVMVLETTRPVDVRSGKHMVHGYYAYWFVGQGRVTPYHWERMFWLGWDRIVHSIAHRWAYIAVAGRRDADTPLFHEQIASFTTALCPALQLAATLPKTPPGKP